MTRIAFTPAGRSARAMKAMSSPPLTELFDERGGAAGGRMDLDVDVGMLTVELSEHARHVRENEGLHDADAQPPP
jgi:hypothetical protein